MTWLGGEKYKLVTMYDECLQAIKMARALCKSVEEVNAKLRELRLDPTIRPEDLNLHCPSCNIGPTHIKLLDFGMTTRKWYYKCERCSYIFSAS